MLDFNGEFKMGNALLYSSAFLVKLSDVDVGNDEVYRVLLTQLFEDGYLLLDAGYSFVDVL